MQGGSTITQQYVKNAFTTGDRTIGRKIREAILASQLDRKESKDKILYDYLSTIYFGEGAYGVGAAAQTYFRTPVPQLTLSQAALLASVIPAPSKYSPRVAPELAEQRRVLVLGEMLAQGRIDQAAHDAAVAEPVWLAVNGDPPGPATIVYPPQAEQSSQPWFTDVYVKQWLEQHLPGCVLNDCPTLDKGGLIVKTTLDLKVQQAAEEEVAKSMGNNDPNLQMALAAVEPPTGYVRAIVGGRDYSTSQYNTALLSPGRQTGSSFKPFVLAAALEEGIPLTKRYSGATFTTGTGDSIHNVEGEGAGPWDLRSATVHSINAVFARLISDVGVEQAEAMARRLGVNIAPYDSVNDGVSIALGVKDATPLDMASAFGVFANHGKRAEPTPVLEVTDLAGHVILDNSKAADNAKPVLSDVIADNITDILRGVLVSGTAAGKGLGDRPSAGKTGTAEDNANAWFVGYTPTLSTAVWMGHLDCGASSPGHNCGLHNINGVRDVFGGTIPASTWQHFMKRARRRADHRLLATRADPERHRRGAAQRAPRLRPRKPPLSRGSPRRWAVRGRRDAPKRNRAHDVDIDDHLDHDPDDVDDHHRELAAWLRVALRALEHGVAGETHEGREVDGLRIEAERRVGARRDTDDLAIGVDDRSALELGADGHVVLDSVSRHVGDKALRDRRAGAAEPRDREQAVTDLGRCIGRDPVQRREVWLIDGQQREVVFVVPREQLGVHVVLPLLAQCDLRSRLHGRGLDRGERREQERLLGVGEHDERRAHRWRSGLIDGRDEEDGRLRFLQQVRERCAACSELLELVELVADVLLGVVAFRLDRLAGVVDALVVVTEKRLDFVGRLLLARLVVRVQHRAAERGGHAHQEQHARETEHRVRQRAPHAAAGALAVRQVFQPHRGDRSSR